jgi:hypothetical protein
VFVLRKLPPVGLDAGVRLQLLNQRRLRDDHNSLVPLEFLLALLVGCAPAGDNFAGGQT